MSEETTKIIVQIGSVTQTYEIDFDPVIIEKLAGLGYLHDAMAERIKEIVQKSLADSLDELKKNLDDIEVTLCGTEKTPPDTE